VSRGGKRKETFAKYLLQRYLCNMEDAQPTVGALADPRELNLEALKGLAHPLRMQLFNALAVYGPDTSSGLAIRLGESSGSTSYHLRQLERHGFVREVEGAGTARERWWERVPGGVIVSPGAVSESPAGRAAVSSVLRQFERDRSQLLGDFVARGSDVLDDDWVNASAVVTANLRLTPEQLAVVQQSWQQWANEVLEPLRGKDQPGARPVQIHFNAFPVLDGEVTSVAQARKE
jgi:DNA-binding transcriptional ArsR family regulator